MLFANLRFYRLPQPWGVSATTLESWLQRRPARPCGALEMKSLGFAPPREGSGLVYSLAGQWLLALERDQKLLPSAVIRQVAADKAAVIEAEQGYAPGRKQLRALREQSADELLPRAFTQRRRTHIWINPRDGWLGLDTGSAAGVDDALEALTQSCDALPLSLVKTSNSASSAMSEWLLNAAEDPGIDPFSIDQDCELKAQGESQAAVRYVRHSLDGDEIRQHLAVGKRPTRLGLIWRDKLSFVLSEQLEIKRLRFLDDEPPEDAEDAGERFDADFALCSGALTLLLPELLQALGGEVGTDHPENTASNS